MACSSLHKRTSSLPLGEVTNTECNAEATSVRRSQSCPLDSQHCASPREPCEPSHESDAGPPEDPPNPPNPAVGVVPLANPSATTAPQQQSLTNLHVHNPYGNPLPDPGGSSSDYGAALARGIKGCSLKTGSSLNPNAPPFNGGGAGRRMGNTSCAVDSCQYTDTAPPTGNSYDVCEAPETMSSCSGWCCYPGSDFVAGDSPLYAPLSEVQESPSTVVASNPSSVVPTSFPNPTPSSCYADPSAANYGVWNNQTQGLQLAHTAYFLSHQPAAGPLLEGSFLMGQMTSAMITKNETALDRAATTPPDKDTTVTFCDGERMPQTFGTTSSSFPVDSMRTYDALPQYNSAGSDLIAREDALRFLACALPPQVRLYDVARTMFLCQICPPQTTSFPSHAPTQYFPPSFHHPNLTPCTPPRLANVDTIQSREGQITQSAPVVSSPSASASASATADNQIAINLAAGAPPPPYGGTVARTRGGKQKKKKSKGPQTPQVTRREAELLGEPKAEKYPFTRNMENPAEAPQCRTILKNHKVFLVAVRPEKPKTPVVYQNEGTPMAEPSDTIDVVVSGTSETAAQETMRVPSNSAMKGIRDAKIGDFGMFFESEEQREALRKAEYIPGFDAYTPSKWKRDEKEAKWRELRDKLMTSETRSLVAFYRAYFHNNSRECERFFGRPEKNPTENKFHFLRTLRDYLHKCFGDFGFYAPMLLTPEVFEAIKTKEVPKSE